MKSRALTPRPGITYWVGFSARGAGNPAGRLRHAATAVKASRSGANVLALCGTSIRPAWSRVNQDVQHEKFTGEHARDCRRCARALSS